MSLLLLVNKESDYDMVGKYRLQMHSQFDMFIQISDIKALSILCLTGEYYKQIVSIDW